MPKYLRKQAKEMVAALITFFEQDGNSIRMHGQPSIPFEAVRERVAAALNISISSVSAISQAVKNNEVLANPQANRQKHKLVLGIDEATKLSIRNVIYEMYRTKQHITRHSVLQILRERDIFHGSPSSLGNILKEIGFHR